MKRLLALVLIVPLLLAPLQASASLNGKVDFSEPRIVAVIAGRDGNYALSANASGYLFSPRIVFSAGHLKDNPSNKEFYVSEPNRELKAGINVVKVQKVFYPKTYKSKVYRDDFSIMVLEKAIARVSSAPLISENLLLKAMNERLPMKITGYGVYQDICKLQNKSAPCRTNNDVTSKKPRSIMMDPYSADEIKEKFGPFDEQIADHLFLVTKPTQGPCPGDSGGSTTVAIDGISYYVGTVPAGFWSSYTCGYDTPTGGETIGYTAPVYKFLNLLREAESYAKLHPEKK